ncbi:placenta-specific protein 9 [Mesocricetus auratus]|uniref:Placenta-specific protein 9 n=1 Tax=Mesocricetus auratus TaxID=10036 RepID=A0ABM2XM26_MESAU|nr:placenta-specific protein 9 [Mesocricetus auratus]
MQPLLCALAGLALLGGVGAGEWGRGPRDTPERRATESPSSSREETAWSPGCDRHVAVQGRLDIMEETVEKTVEHLEAEVTGLLGLLEELASNLPPGPFSLEPDLLGGDHF